MFAKDFRKAAWGKLSGNWATAVVAYLIYALLMGVLSSVGFGTLVLGGVMSVGLYIVLMQIARNGSSGIENVFSGFRKGLGNNIVAGILVQLFTFLWALLFIIPGIVKAYSYSMTYMILADNPDMSPTEAIKASQAMMKGNKWRLFCLDLSFIGWILLTILTFGILGFWVTPYNLMAHVEFYESLKPKAETDEAFVGGMADNGDQA